MLRASPPSAARGRRRHPPAGSAVPPPPGAIPGEPARHAPWLDAFRSDPLALIRELVQGERGVCRGCTPAWRRGVRGLPLSRWEEPPQAPRLAAARPRVGAADLSGEARTSMTPGAQGPVRFAGRPLHLAPSPPPGTTRRRPPQGTDPPRAPRSTGGSCRRRRRGGRNRGTPPGGPRDRRSAGGLGARPAGCKIYMVRSGREPVENAGLPPAIEIVRPRNRYTDRLSAATTGDSRDPAENAQSVNCHLARTGVQVLHGPPAARMPGSAPPARRPRAQEGSAGVTDRNKTGRALVVGVAGDTVWVGRLWAWVLGLSGAPRASCPSCLIGGPVLALFPPAVAWGLALGRRRG